MKTEDIVLKLKNYSCYQISKSGVWFYTERGFKVFVPKRILKRINIKGGDLIV